MRTGRLPMCPAFWRPCARPMSWNVAVPSGTTTRRVGLDRQALELERRLNLQAGKVLGQVLVPIVGEVEIDSSGYCAIASKIAENSVTLGQWLSTASAQEARRVARVLF